MAIHYTIQPLSTPISGDIYIARVQTLDAVVMRDLVDRIVANGSTVNRADILSVLDDYHTTIADVLMLGMSVVTPTACYRPSIKGTFAGLGDSFDPTRHRVNACISPGALLKRKLDKDGRVTKEIGEKPRPVLVEYLDLASGTANQVLTPDEGAHLTGQRLRFDPDDPEQGVFFVAADNTRTRAERYLDVRPSKVILLAPALPVGDYGKKP
jgi:hypothetical protein